MADNYTEDVNETQQTNKADPNIRPVKLGAITIPINIGFVRSPLGIVIAISTCLSLLCAILISASNEKNCYAVYKGSYDFFEFVSVSWFIISLFRYLIFMLSGSNGLFLGRFIPWTLVMMANNVVYMLFFFISSIVVAVNSCWRGGYKASAAFGFITLVTVAVEFVLLLLKLRKEHAPTQNRFLLILGVQRGSNQSPPEYDPERNMETDPPKY